MLGHRDHQMHGGGGTDAHAGLVRGALADYACNGEYLDDCVPLNIYYSYDGFPLNMIRPPPLREWYFQSRFGIPLVRP